jgi:mannose-6-phosphate isomerase-like protein (cupin superfamily)
MVALPDSGVLLGPGEGEDIGGRIRIKLDRDELTLTETVGASATEPHVHDRHADAFFLLEGDFSVRLGDDEIALEPGDFALAPPGMVHCFTSRGGRWLNLHAPGGGFAEYLRSGADFDNRDPAEGDERRSSEGVLRRRGEGELIEPGPGARGIVKASADDGIGSVTVLEFELDGGSAGPPPHRHAQLTDSFYVLEGTLTVLLGDREREAGPGTYAGVPPGNVHTVSNPGAEPVRFLNVTMPGGLERYLRELAAADPSEFPAIAARNDVFPA